MKELSLFTAFMLKPNRMRNKIREKQAHLQQIKLKYFKKNNQSSIYTKK